MRHAILITVDTLRPDRLGAYGYQRADSPNFDALASESIRFDQAYAHSSMTVPSFASLFTGMLPAKHGMFANRGRLAQGFPTLATELHAADFSTAAFLGNYALRASRGFGRGFDTYTEEFKATEAVRALTENRAGAVTDAAIDWLSERAPDERLFLWVHYQEPHGPYTPPDFRPPDESAAQLELLRNTGNSGRGGIPKYQWLGHGRIAEYEARYDGEIREFDRHLGRLLEALDERGILDKSVLIFASDHGEAFGEDDLYLAHGDGLGDALLRVPLLLRLPDQPGSVRDDRVRLIDVSPTLLEAVGLSNTALGGKSLRVGEGDRPLVAQVHTRGERWRSYRESDFEIRQMNLSAPKLYGAEKESAKAAEEIGERMLEILETSSSPSGTAARNVAFR